MEVELEEFRAHIDHYMAVVQTKSIRFMNGSYHIVDMIPSRTEE